MGLLKPNSVSNPPIAQLQNKITISTECATVILMFETATAKTCSELSDLNC